VWRGWPCRAHPWGESLGHGRRIARARHGRIEKNGVEPHRQRLRGMARKAKAGIHHQRHIRQMGA